MKVEEGAKATFEGTAEFYNNSVQNTKLPTIYGDSYYSEQGKTHKGTALHNKVWFSADIPMRFVALCRDYTDNNGGRALCSIWNSLLAAVLGLELDVQTCIIFSLFRCMYAS